MKTVEEFIKSLWDQTKPHMKREIIASREIYTWGKKEVPTIEDIDKFFSISDFKQKRKFSPTKVTLQTLKGWHSKESLLIYIYPHSSSLAHQSDFQKVKRDLIRTTMKQSEDAKNMQSIFEIQKKLMETHKNTLVADTVAWTAWASFIYNIPEEEQNEYIEKLPPSRLTHMFKLIKDDEKLKKNLIIVQNVSQQNKENMAIIRDAYQSMEIKISNALSEFNKCLAKAEKGNSDDNVFPSISFESSALPVLTADQSEKYKISEYILPTGDKSSDQDLK